MVCSVKVSKRLKRIVSFIVHVLLMGYLFSWFVGFNLGLLVIKEIYCHTAARSHSTTILSPSEVMFFNVYESIINPPPNSPSKGGIQKIVDFFPRVAHTQMDKIEFIFKRKFCGARFPLWRGIKGEDIKNHSFTMFYLFDFTFQCYFERSETMK